MPKISTVERHYPKVDVNDTRKYRRCVVGYLHEYSPLAIESAVRAVENQFDTTLTQPFDIMRLDIDQLITFLRTLLADNSVVAAAQGSHPTENGIVTKLIVWKELPVDAPVLDETSDLNR